MAGSPAPDAGPEGPWLPAWDGAHYAANTAHHRRHDAAFLATVPLAPTDRVLDLGCGAGDFTALVADLVPAGEVVGVDPQVSLLDEARRRARPNQRFVQGTAQDLGSLLDGETFDVVLSRSVLHWLPWPDHVGVLRACRGLLRPGGRLRTESGGGDNARTVVAYFDRVAADVAGPGAPSAPWTFPDAGAYLDLVEDCGFDLAADGFVRLQGQRRPFDRDTLLGWVTSQSVQAYEAGVPVELRAALRTAAVERIDELRRPDGSYDVTFVRLEVLAYNPEG